MCVPLFRHILKFIMYMTVDNELSFYNGSMYIVLSAQVPLYNIRYRFLKLNFTNLIVGKSFTYYLFPSTLVDMMV